MLQWSKDARLWYVMDWSALTKYHFFAQLNALPFVDKIILYGSRARGDNAERADIDLAIVCPRAGLYDWNQVMEVVDNADTLLKIDCVRFDQLSETNPLKQAIIREGVTLFQH